MTKREFFKLLARYSWKRGGRHGNRFVKHKGGSSVGYFDDCGARGRETMVYCPLTYVARRHGNAMFSTANWRSAAEKLGMDQSDAREIADAADGTRRMVDFVYTDSLLRHKWLRFLIRLATF